LLIPKNHYRKVDIGIEKTQNDIKNKQLLSKKEVQKMDNKHTEEANDKRKQEVLVIEWKHLDAAGETCDRCYDTGENLHAEIKRLQRKLEPQGITLQLIETKLDEANVKESNQILINGVMIEQIIGLQVQENHCASCSDLVGSETYCRTIMFNGEEFEDVPAKAIRQAVMKVLQLDDEEAKADSTSGCSCGCSGESCC
jgi:hypothetical protein